VLTSMNTVHGTAGMSPMTLQRLLDACSQMVSGSTASGSPVSGAGAAGSDEELAALCRVFLDGGMSALRRRRDSTDWLQYDLAFAAVGRRRCYPELATAVRELLATRQLDDFFFMHKPPGLRVRFRPAAPARSTVDQVVRRHLLGWQREGIVAAWRPARYEPEAQLFGGPTSMRSVHKLFTADSLVWLAYHAAAVDAAAVDGAAGPAWALSLLLLRPVFDALGIAGWEDLDVWDRVRWQTGRRLHPQALAEVDLAPLSVSLRATWTAPDRLLDELSPQLHLPLVEYREAVADEAQRWLRDYFRSDEATLGPRAALAYLIIFHWNRAGLPGTRQSLLTEALAAHPAGTGGLDEVAR
jgi:thiopeptide-type bacteriocin biosynthesis protein